MCSDKCRCISCPYARPEREYDFADGYKFTLSEVTEMTHQTLVVSNERKVSRVSEYDYYSVGCMGTSGPLRGHVVYMFLSLSPNARWVWETQVAHPQMVTVGSAVNLVVRADEYQGRIRLVRKEFLITRIHVPLPF